MTRPTAVTFGTSNSAPAVFSPLVTITGEWSTVTGTGAVLIVLRAPSRTSCASASRSRFRPGSRPIDRRRIKACLALMHNANLQSPRDSEYHHGGTNST